MVVRQIDMSVKVRMEAKEQIIHINRIRRFLQDTITVKPQTWTPPLFFNSDLDDDSERIAKNDPLPASDSPGVRTARSGQAIRPVDYYGY